MYNDFRIVSFLVLTSKSFTYCENKCDHGYNKRQLHKGSYNINEKGEIETRFFPIATTSAFDIEETQVITTTEITRISQTERQKYFTDIESESKYKIKEICTHFKYVGGIRINKMIDLWQTAYYHATNKVPCFKMFIRKLTMKEKQVFKQKYGDFDDTVEWEDCNLEIRSSVETTKHFLQGCEKGHGVLENIIIGEKKEADDTTKYFIKPESPDQWLVVHNLLLMRYCDTGDVIVFSRVPHKPQRKVIIDALKLFGENNVEGKFICGDQPPIKKKSKNTVDEDFIRFRT